ncbi:MULTISPECIES: nitrilase-related carbon-nitrogen hydrolase [Marinobacter]|uniref:nitrilase-related carbon-nitrogen hydrolase n=1 Tax=Marinobacter TaxID=2742 RepID=UPI000DAC5C1F|nr:MULTISPECIES: nitrilase-related carbon-nitrogen hydrolase [Marinobacter]
MHHQDALHVGAAQINSVLGDVARNLDTHQRLIEQGRAAGLELLVFPELSLTGYSLRQRVVDVAMPATDAHLLELARAAGEMQTVVGFVEEVSPGEYYNALAILQHGEVQAVHRKINLPTYGGLEEGKWFSPADATTLCPVVEGWPASYLICADLWHPGLVHEAMMQRPSLLCAPINSASGIVSESFSNEDNWALNLSFYAMTYGTPIVMANRYGPEGESHFWGGSRIVGARGQILAAAEDGEQLIHATLRRTDIARARFELPTHRDATRFPR